MASVDFSMDDVIPVKGFVSLCPGAVSNYFSVEKAEAVVKFKKKSKVFNSVCL